MPLVLLAVVIVTVGYALWPILTRQTVQLATSHSDTPSGRLALRKEILLTNISDLDFEFAMGKLAREDYDNLRESLKRQAALVIEQMDVLRQGSHDMESVATAPNGGSPETAVAPATRFCADCGGELPGGAKFCPGCGVEVSVA